MTALAIDEVTGPETAVAALVTVITAADLPEEPSAVAEPVEATEADEDEGGDEAGAESEEESDAGPAPVVTAPTPAPKPESKAASEPRDINLCTVSLRVEIFPPEVGGPRLAIVAASSHGDEPVTRMVSFTSDFDAVGHHLADVYQQLAAQMPARAAADQARQDAAAKKAARDQARVDKNKAKARSASAQATVVAPKPAKRQQSLLDVPDEPGGGMTAPATESAAAPVAAAAPGPVMAMVVEPAPEPVDAVAVEPAAAPVAAQPEPATAAPEAPKAAKRAKARTPRSKKPAAPEAAQVAAEATPAAQSPATFVAPESGSLEERVNARMAAAAKTLADTPAPTARCGVTQPAQPAAAAAPAEATAAPAPAPVPASGPQPAATPAAEGAPAGKQINLFGF